MTVSKMVVTCSLVVLLAACSGADGERNGQGQPVEGATFTTTITADPGNLHPLKSVSTATNGVVVFTYDYLINAGVDGEIRAHLAEDWKVTDDQVTFTLRDGITCEDGTELEASHVAANFEWIADPANASPYLAGGLENYTVKADDTARTVTITVEQAYGFLLQAAGAVPIVCPEGLADPSSISQETNGTGPFVLTDYAPDDQLTLSVREGYEWGPDGASTEEPGFPAEVALQVVRDPSTAVNLFLDGVLNDVTASGPDEARLKGQGFETLEIAGGPLELWFNQRDGLANADPDVRRAITMALDLDDLTTVFTERNGVRARDLTSLPPDPCVSDSTEGTLPEFDPHGAAQLLDSAGWAMGPDGVRTKDGQALSLTASYVSGDRASDAGMELVAQVLADVGVQVELKGEGSNAVLATLFGEEAAWDIAFLSLQIIYPSEFVGFASGPLPPLGQNFGAVDNPDYERLAAEAQRTPGQEGCELWAQGEQALFEQANVVPIANSVSKIYTRGASYEEGWLSYVEPTTIRMYGD